MIHYHGGPLAPTSAAIALWTCRHGLSSFEYPAQTPLMAEVAQSFILDCGAFTKWRKGNGVVDVDAYAEWVRGWQRHPGFDWAVVPDVIDGTEEDNAKMCARWLQQKPRMKPGGVVWHLHESLDRLEYLILSVNSGIYARLCLGSSGQWSKPGTDEWWARMDEAREVICDSDGFPRCKLHGLRMLSPTIFSHIPLASADSCNIALNSGIDSKWTGAYQPVTRATKALVLADRIEHHACAVRWSAHRGIEPNKELIG